MTDSYTECLKCVADNFNKLKDNTEVTDVMFYVGPNEDIYYGFKSYFAIHSTILNHILYTKPIPLLNDEISDDINDNNHKTRKGSLSFSMFNENNTDIYTNMIGINKMGIKLAKQNSATIQDDKNETNGMVDINELGLDFDDDLDENDTNSKLNQVGSTKKSVIFKDILPETFDYLIHLFYGSKPNIIEFLKKSSTPYILLYNLLYAATKFDIIPLRTLCLEYIKEKVMDYNELLNIMIKLNDNTEIFKDSETIIDDIINQSVCLSDTNIVSSVVLNTINMIKIPIQLLIKILSSDNLNCAEDDLYEAIVKWCKSYKNVKSSQERPDVWNGNSDNNGYGDKEGQDMDDNKYGDEGDGEDETWKENFGEIKHCIRFPLLSTNYLIDEIYQNKVLSEKEVICLLSMKLDTGYENKMDFNTKPRRYIRNKHIMNKGKKSKVEQCNENLYKFIQQNIKTMIGKKNFGDVTFEVDKKVAFLDMMKNSQKDDDEKAEQEIDTKDGGKLVYGIRGLFSLHSIVFESMLFGKMYESTHNDTIIDIIDIPYISFKWINELFYGLSPILTYANTPHIYYISKKYLIKNLDKACLQFMNKRINDYKLIAAPPSDSEKDMESVNKLRQSAANELLYMYVVLQYDYGLHSIANKILKISGVLHSCSLEMLIQCEMFRYIPSKLLHRILWKRADPAIVDQMKLFDFIIIWSKTQFDISQKFKLNAIIIEVKDENENDDDKSHELSTDDVVPISKTPGAPTIDDDEQNKDKQENGHNDDSKSDDDGGDKDIVVSDIEEWKDLLKPLLKYIDLPRINGLYWVQTIIPLNLYEDDEIILYLSMNLGNTTLAKAMELSPHLNSIRLDITPLSLKNNNDKIFEITDDYKLIINSTDSGCRKLIFSSSTTSWDCISQNKSKYGVEKWNIEDTNKYDRYLNGCFTPNFHIGIISDPFNRLINDGINDLQSIATAISQRQIDDDQGLSLYYCSRDGNSFNGKEFVETKSWKKAYSIDMEFDVENLQIRWIIADENSKDKQDDNIICQFDVEPPVLMYHSKFNDNKSNYWQPSAKSGCVYPIIQCCSSKSLQLKV